MDSLVSVHEELDSNWTAAPPRRCFMQTKSHSCRTLLVNLDKPETSSVLEAIG